MTVQPDVSADLADLENTLSTVERVLDIDKLARRIDELEHQATDPDLWNDQDHAQKVTSELSYAQETLRRAKALRARLGDLQVLYELDDEEESEARATER